MDGIAMYVRVSGRFNGLCYRLVAVALSVRVNVLYALALVNGFILGVSSAPFLSFVHSRALPFRRSQ